MLEVKVIASGSTGNSTLIKSSTGDNILLDAGIGYQKIAAAVGFDLINYALITHEHGDHAQKTTIKSLLSRGAEIYMTEGTKTALNLSDRHNLHVCRDYPFILPKVSVQARKVYHDAAEPVAFRLHDDDDDVLYVTDANQVPLFSESEFTKLIIETNFSEKMLLESKVDANQKQRIFENHLSVEKVIAYFELMKKFNALKSLKEVHLIHISKRHGDGAEFKARIAEKIGDIPIYTH